MTTVTVKYVNPPKPGKEWWSIKDESGTSYWRKLPIPENLKDQSCDITFQEGKDGFRKLTSINAATNIHPPQSNGHARAPKNDEDIAVLALAKSFIEAGKIQDVAHVSRALKVLRDQWREYKSEAAEPSDFHDDPIPDWGSAG